MDYDVIKGDRTYQYFKGEALYPFGHGLSYSTFKYNGITLDRKQAFSDKEQEISVTVSITNTGDRAGEEVVQLYGHAKDSRVKRPRKELLAFRRVMLAGGESLDVTFTLPLSELAMWDVTRERFCIETGTYVFMGGSSSAELPVSAELEVHGEVIPLRNLYQPVKAINYDDYEGVLIGECYEGGSAVEVKDQSGWIVFKDAQFGEGASSIKLRAASEQPVSIEIRLQGADGKLIGETQFTGTGAQAWNDYTAKLERVSGIQDVYVVVNGRASLSTVQFV
ncbi:Thermostable beta-glucosidase B [compost metagenome]